MFFDTAHLLLLPIALLLGALGAGTGVLLEMWNQDKWIKPTPKMVIGMILGVIAAGISWLMEPWLMGDGVYAIVFVSYFAIGAIAPLFLGDLIEGYKKRYKNGEK